MAKERPSPLNRLAIGRCFLLPLSFNKSLLYINCRLSRYTEELSVEIDHYEEKDYTEVDNKIELLNLKPRDRAVLDCYMAGMTCNEIAEFLDISRITVWRRRTRAQVKYKALFF